MLGGIIAMTIRLYTAGLISDDELKKIQRKVKLETLDKKIDEMKKNSFNQI